MKQKINCDFFQSSWMIHGEVYFCKIESKFISEHLELDLIGTHLTGHSNENVDGIAFDNCKISKVPQGLTKIFPNLKFLSIYNSKLKNIEYEDLKEYSSVREFEFGMNEIEYLPGDLFANMKNLELISFNDNKIQIIEPQLLDGLHKLKYVSLKSNLCIDKVFNSEVFYGNASLDEIKKEISEKYSNSPLSRIFEKNQKLKFGYKKIFLENQNLLLENSRLKRSDDGVYDDFKKLINSETLKDFTIKVENEEFKVHKMLLAARSSVFAEMFKENSAAQCLKLVDISVEIFRIILNFIYTDDFPIDTLLNYLHLFMAAGRLNIEKLKNFAAEKLIDQVNTDNAMDIMILSNKYNCEKLKDKSFEEIKKLLPDRKFDNSLAKNPEKLRKIIEVKRKQEELLRSMEFEIDELLN